jgi:hypothetical protein
VTFLTHLWFPEPLEINEVHRPAKGQRTRQPVVHRRSCRRVHRNYLDEVVADTHRYLLPSGALWVPGWAEWCSRCLPRVPDLRELMKQYMGETEMGTRFLRKPEGIA